jgi:CheY-like chemotaxis protein
VARALRARGATTPLVAMSGYSDSPVIANPSEFGFDAALGKPFRKADLSALLERLLGPAAVRAAAPAARA